MTFLRAEDALDALERQVIDGKIALRSALAYAWQHGCTHGGGGPWPDYDVRRVGFKWAIVRVKDGRVASTWETEHEAHDAYVQLVCTPSIRPSSRPPIR